MFLSPSRFAIRDPAQFLRPSQNWEGKPCTSRSAAYKEQIESSGAMRDVLGSGMSTMTRDVAQQLSARQHQGGGGSSPGRFHQAVAPSPDGAQWQQQHTQVPPHDFAPPPAQQPPPTTGTRAAALRQRAAAPQEAKNRPNIDWQEKIHREILRGLRNISDTVKQRYEILL
jgi:hypothetical protein